MSVFNPLDKENLGRSVTDALLAQEVFHLPRPRTRNNSFSGAGIYAIYYTGIVQPFEPYEPIAARNRDGLFEQPIYIGKAIPAGARKGGVGTDDGVGFELYVRLREHASSIIAAENLNIEDFSCRYLVVDDIWIPLGESLAIQRFNPIWNVLIDGFGNHDPGRGR